MPTAAFTFLDPAAGLVAAAVAFPLLLLLYFLKLRRRPVRVSSTMLWRDAAHDLQVNTPFRMLRASWLLLLHLLILALLVAALARPAIEGVGAPPQRLIILVDRSASMNARDAGPPDEPVTRLDAAKDAARGLVDRLAGESETMLIAFAHRADTLANFTRDRGLLRNQLDALEPTDQPDDLAEALRVVEAFARQPEDDATARPARVVIISDGGPAATGQTLPEVGGAEVRFQPVGPAPDAAPENLAIVAASARRDFEDPALVRLFVRVQNASPEPAEAALNTNLDDRLVDTARLEIPAADAGAGVPGERAHTVSFEQPAGGLVVTRLARTDALPSDDAAALRLEPPGAPSILLVRPNTETTLLDDLLREAFATLEPRALESANAAEYRARAQAGTLAGFDLVVFDRVRPEQLPPAPSISFGAGLPVPGLLYEPHPDPASAPPTEFAFWDRAHPVMRYVALGNVNLAAPASLTLPRGGRTDPAEVLARGPGGPLIVALTDRGVRRIVVAFELGRSLWWRDPSFPVFIANAVAWLTRPGGAGDAPAFTTTETIRVRVAPDAETLEITGPTEQRRAVPEDAAAITVGPLPLAGVYEARGADPADTPIPVNLFSPRESALATSDTLNIAGRDTAGTRGASDAPRELRWWFVLAAFALLCVEWLLYAWRMRV